MVRIMMMMMMIMMVEVMVMTMAVNKGEEILTVHVFANVQKLVQGLHRR